MELCEHSLLDQLQRIGKFAATDGCRALAQVAEAVDAAHREGVVHRDIKPANVLKTAAGQYMMSDFGISSVAGNTTGQTESVGFTAGYVAPETLQGETPGPAADVYALGATLFHMSPAELPMSTPNRAPTCWPWPSG